MHAREIENVNTSKIKSIFKKEEERGRDYTHARTRTHTHIHLQILACMHVK